MLLFFSGDSNPFALITPDPGLFIWTVVVFVILWFILAKFAFKPIAKALREREQSISDSLQEANRARAEVAELKNENEELLRQAREERTKILREANDLKSKIIAEAREEAKIEADKLIENARHDINSQKREAFNEAKKEIGALAVSVSERLLRQKLDNSEAQNQLIASLIQDAKLN